MKIDEALIVFYKLKNNTLKKDKLRIYNEYISILLDLRLRDLTSNQTRIIENKLSTLDLNNSSRLTTKNLQKRLTSLEHFLRKNFSIISENYYINTGMTLWFFSSIILLFCFGQFSVIGALITTIVFGVTLDKQAKNQNRVIIINNELIDSYLPIETTKSNNFSLNKEGQKETGLQNYRRKKLEEFKTKKELFEEENLKKEKI